MKCWKLEKIIEGEKKYVIIDEQNNCYSIKYYMGESWKDKKIGELDFLKKISIEAVQLLFKQSDNFTELKASDFPQGVLINYK